MTYQTPWSLTKNSYITLSPMLIFDMKWVSLFPRLFIVTYPPAVCSSSMSTKCHFVLTISWWQSFRRTFFRMFLLFLGHWRFTMASRILLSRIFFLFTTIFFFLFCQSVFQPRIPLTFELTTSGKCFLRKFLFFFVILFVQDFSSLFENAIYHKNQ